MVVRRLTALMVCALGCWAGADAADEPETIVLLHGLARTDWSMKPLERRLEKAGYAVANLHYDSTDHGPRELVADVAAQVDNCCASAQKLHFVTHSLGGILVRAYLVGHSPENLGRVVMIAPPNKGSELADFVGKSELLSWTMGPTAAELGTSLESLPNRLPAADFELGVIAGIDSFNPLTSAIIDGESDGTVSVESTKLAGMRDFITVPYSHTFIMQVKPVAQQVIAFLRDGRFDHGPPADQETGGP